MASPGAHIPWDDQALDALATIGHADIDAARAYWRVHCRPADRALLEQGSDDERRCLRALDYVLAQSAKDVETLRERLRTGAIDTAGWQLGMATIVRMNPICAVAAGCGAWSRITMDMLR